MKIVVAPNALKGSLTATQAARAMADGIAAACDNCETVTLPIADGGDGLLEVLQLALDASWQQTTARDPLGRPVSTRYLYSPGRQLAVVEMAAVSGLALLQTAELEPATASTYGLGEVLVAAAGHGAQEVLLGIGGSATNDGGSGLAQAVGMRLLDADGRQIDGNGGNLRLIDSIDTSQLHPAVRQLSITVICDVDNPLLGPFGATSVFGPQKGVSNDRIPHFEAGLGNWADVLQRTTGKDIRTMPGGGAAGGLGAGLHALFDAELRPGAELVLDTVGADQALDGADLVLTAEGQLDDQTLAGKAPAAIAARARQRGVPCFAIAGQLSGDLNGLRNMGIDAAFSLCPGPVTLEQAMQQAESYLRNTTTQVTRCFIASQHGE